MYLVMGRRGSLSKEREMWILKHDLLSPAFLPQISNFLCIITWNERITTGVEKKKLQKIV